MIWTKCLFAFLVQENSLYDTRPFEMRVDVNIINGEVPTCPAQ